MDGSLTDVSGEGFRLILDEELPEGTMIAVETDAHLILAQTRHCRPQGNQFTTGARRVHTISTFDLSASAGRIDKVQVLINDYQLRMHKQTAVTKAREQEKPDSHATMEGANRFEPHPVLTFHAIPAAGNPALPSLASMAPSRRNPG